jgi:hypothetical protein
VKLKLLSLSTAPPHFALRRCVDGVQNLYPHVAQAAITGISQTFFRMTNRGASKWITFAMQAAVCHNCPLDAATLRKQG